MDVSYDEGVPSHVGCESCVGAREDVGEVSTGEEDGVIPAFTYPV
jgi:hypothetical protein